MRKVFVCGSQMSGQNILIKLLDGHSDVVCSHVHGRVGFALLSRPGAAYVKKKWSKNRESFDVSVPTIDICYESGDRGKIW
jgi:hypothetical protein